MKRSILCVLMCCLALDIQAQERGSSAPFISGDTFREFSDFTFDEISREIDPASVKAGDIIFVKTDYLEEYFEKIHPLIKNPYVLITHNSDYHVPGAFAQHLDDPKLLAWFGQNVENCDHPKMHRIPIGLANKMWTHGNVSVFKEMLSKVSDEERVNLLYMNFTPETYPKERMHVVSLFKDKPYCIVSNPKSLSDYLSDLKKTKFVLSPRGNGIDCHRTWESLVMGAIPIVKSSSLDSMYEGLPVLIVDDWSQVNEEFLESKYREMRSKTFQHERMFVAYWLEKIRALSKLNAAAVTYELGGGRFGDQLLAYLHAKWVSYRYQIPFLYKPFAYCDELMLHEVEQRFQESDLLRFETTLRPRFGDVVEFKANKGVLYVIPYFPEAQWEHTPQNGWYFLPVDWHDAGFKAAIKRLIAPTKLKPSLELPKGRFSVAVHMRLGGGFDDDNTRRQAPLKLPPVSYYKTQIRHIYEMLGKKPLYVHIFTDDNEPQKLIDECQEFTSDLDVIYGSRPHGNAHDSNVLQDFFEMTRFDCLIRAESNFSIVASKISDFHIEISPASFVWDGPNEGHVDKVFVKEGNKTHLVLQDSFECVFQDLKANVGYAR